MIYCVSESKILEAPDYTGIIEQMMDNDFDLPLVKFKLQYKRRVIKRMGKSIFNSFKSDKDFIEYLIGEDIMKEMMRVFVYGTLKRGYGNHKLLAHCKKYQEEDGVIEGFDLYASGIPFAKHGEGNLHVEIYLVDFNVMRRLDELEGHPSMYKRELVVTKDGRLGWVYVYQRSVDRLRMLDNGNWKGYNINNYKY